MGQNDWWMRGQPPVKGTGEVTSADLAPGAVEEEGLAAEAVSLASLGDAVRAVMNDLINTLQGSYLLSAPALAIGTDKTKVAYAEIRWSVNGVRYRIAAGEVAFTATTHDLADPDEDPREAIYVLSVAAGASAPTITKGTTAAEDEAVAPATPAGHVKLGEVLIQHDGSAIFDATTSELDEAHLTVTYTDEDPHVIATI